MTFVLSWFSFNSLISIHRHIAEMQFSTLDLVASMNGREVLRNNVKEAGDVES